MSRGVLAVVFLCACSSSEPATSRSAPDGIPLALPDGGSLAAWLALDLDGDRDRDLVAVIQGAGPGLRVLRYARRGRRYADPERLESPFLEALPSTSIVPRGIAVVPIEPGFLRVEVRYEESCVEDEREIVKSEVYFPRRRGLAEVFRANASYRTVPCPLATPEFEARCDPIEDPGIEVRSQVHEGAREVEVNVEGVTFAARPVDGLLVGDPESATRGLREAIEETQRLVRTSDPETRLARLAGVERLADLVCRGRGPPACHGSPIGVPEEARPVCKVDDLLLRVRTERARILADAGRAREALHALGPPVDPSGGEGAARLRTARAEVLATVAPANAREIGKIPRARPPVPPDGHVRGPFAWPDEDQVVYVAGGSGRQTIHGLWRSGVGDLGMLKPEKRYLAARLRSEITSAGGEWVVAASDRFGVFLCPTSDEERSCRAFARDSLGRESGSRCDLVDEALRGHGGGRVIVDPCAGATDPLPLGFLDEARFAIVAAGSADPVVATAAAPSSRSPMPAGPSRLFEGTDFLPDGSARLVWTHEGTFLVPRGGGPERRVLPPGDELRWITVSPSGRRFVALEGERGARVWELP